MKRLSKWTVEAWLLSDELAKEIESNSQRADDIDGHSAEATGQEKDMPQVTATQPTSKLDAGSYTVTCTAVAESVMENSQYDNPDIYRFYFDVHDMEDENGEQATTDAICSRKLTPSSKLWKFLTAFGLRPEIGKTFELEDCIGKTVMAVVEPNKAGTYNNVASLVPLPRGAQSAPSAAQEARQPVDVSDVPFDTAEPPLADALHEAAALADWTEQLRTIGYSTKEIIDHAKAKKGKALRDLSAAERDELMAEMTA